jgi:hypothetical protein
LVSVCAGEADRAPVVALLRAGGLNGSW